MDKKVCIAYAEGCPRSYADTGILFRYFETNGWTITIDPMKADIILVGTCGFSKQSEDISINLLSSIATKNPKATFIAFGCLPGINAEALTERFKIIPIERSSLHQLDEITDARVPISEIRDVNLLDDYMDLARNVFTAEERKKALREGSTLIRASEFATRLSPYPNCADTTIGQKLFNIRVAYGCLSECTYCAIRRASGKVRSKPLDVINQEFSAGLSEGHQAFRLLAEDVGAYGQDIQLSIVDLLEELFSHKEDFTLCWDDFHPRWLIQYSSQLLPLMADNCRKIEHIGLPVQSGSDRVLRLMNREYTSGEVLDCLSKLKEVCPDLRIDTHFLIGFPGESSSDFAQTLHLLEQIGFYRATPFIYTDRPNTESMNMPGKISVFTKCWRLWRFRMKAASVNRQRSSRSMPVNEENKQKVK